MAEVDPLKLREKLLDRRVEAIKESIQRARTTWLTSTLLTFVIGTVIFNATAGYTSQQITRRSQLVRALSQEFGAMHQAIANDAVLRVSLIDGTGELGYLKELLPAAEPAVNDDGEGRAFAESLRVLRLAAAYELQSYVARRSALENVTVPLIGVNISVVDIGIIGGLALVIVGYWLLAALRRENHAFGEFIRTPDGSVAFTTKHSGYSDQELAYAYHSISQHMIFTVSSKGSPINILTLVAFFAPPALMLFNHLTTVVMGGLRAFDYFQPRFLAEGVIAVLVVVVWLCAFYFQIGTVRALQAWGESVQSPPPSGPGN